MHVACALRAGRKKTMAGEDEKERGRVRKRGAREKVATRGDRHVLLAERECLAVAARCPHCGEAGGVLRMVRTSAGARRDMAVLPSRNTEAQDK